MSHDSSARILATLEEILAIPCVDLRAALSLACDTVAAALRADKVDAFLLDPTKNTLVAMGTSTQPLSHLQRSAGLDVMPVANGGSVVRVFVGNTPGRVGRLGEDTSELIGVRELLKIESQIAVPIEVGNERRGVLAIASQARDFFTEEDERFAVSITRWVGAVAHRAELIEEIGRNAVEQGRRAAADELVTTLAHDLRNFISPISARLQLLQRRAARDAREPDIRDSEAAMRAVDRLARLISDILDVARIDQGLFEVDGTPTELGVIASSVVETLSAPGHEIRLDAPDEVVVAADAARLTQCIENIVGNAIQHSPPHGSIVVHVTKELTERGPRAILDVVDEGPGISPELMPKLFMRFSRSATSGGLGLGLYLAKRIAVAHGGDLFVESALGKGTRFRIELPLFTES